MHEIANQDPNRVHHRVGGLLRWEASTFFDSCLNMDAVPLRRVYVATGEERRKAPISDARQSMS